MNMGVFLAFTFCLSNAAFASDRDNIGAVPARLISELNTWLDTETEYREWDNQPLIKLIEAEQADKLHGVADRSGGRIRGLYDAEIETIYLTEPWSPDNPRDVGVLLHELVHHRQKERHWYCEQAQEWRAYQIQAQWLAERNIADGFYWPAILLQSSCAKRDVHPE